MNADELDPDAVTHDTGICKFFVYNIFSSRVSVGLV